MDAPDIVRIARRRAGLTQQQLGERSGHPRETIARWEAGAREPSLAALKSLVEAAGLDLVLNLAERDSTLDDLVADQLERSPVERLARLLPAPAVRDLTAALTWVAGARTPLIVIGSVAAALQGAPQRPDAATVEVVSADPYSTEREMETAGLAAVDSDDRWAEVDRREPWLLPDGGAVAIALNVPGSEGYRDLRRDANQVRLTDETEITVAHPRDLLRLADASPRESERARVPGLRALLARTAPGSE